MVPAPASQAPPRAACPELHLPPPLPGIVAAVGEDELRWLCLRLAEALQAGPLAAVWQLEVDEFSDLAGELAELVVHGLAGRQRQRAVIAWVRLWGRHGPLELDEGRRQSWLGLWSGQLQRVPLPAYLARPLERWMEALTAQWVQPGAATVLAFPRASPG